MATKKLSAIIEIGGAVRGTLGAATGAVKARMEEIGSAIRAAEKRQKLLSEAIDTFAKQGKDVDGLREKYRKTTEELTRQRKELEKLTAAQRTMSAGKDAMRSSGGVVVGAAVAAAATVGAPIKEAAEFEKAMLGVAKQVEGARDKSGNLTGVYFDMAKQIQELGREIPIATNEIADMVTAGARMGVAKKELIGFTRTAAMMASAFELPAGELADDMGKIAGLFQIPIPKIGDLADAINYLDDNAISKGRDIIEVMKRIGGTAQTLKMPAKEAAALGSTFLTLGATAEVAATASNAVMRELAIAQMQPKRFRAGLKAIGMDAKRVQAEMAKDATGTIMKVLDALKKVPEEKRLQVTTELFGKEYGDDVAKLAEGFAEYRRQVALAKSEEAKGSMSREFQAARAITLSQWQMTKNVITELAVNIGSVLLPAVNGVMGALAPVVASTAEWVRENKDLVGNVIALAGTFGGVIVGLNAVGFAVGAVTAAFGALKIAVATNPVGLALAVFATAAVQIYRNWDPLKELFNNLFKDITATAREAFDWILGKIDAIGAGWRKTKEFFGFGPEPVPQKAAPAAPLPQVPQMAQRGGNTTVTQTQQNTFNITQQPGEDARALSERIQRDMERRQQVQQRGQMYDAMGGAY